MSMDTSLLDHEGLVEYYTHDNGARPFKVVVTLNNKITIYKLTGLTELYTTKVLEIDDYRKLFVGYDRRYPEEEGQSILIKLNKYKYISVGADIYEFETDDEIKEYVSEIGNSDVIYDYAIGQEYIYLLLEKKKLLIDNYNPYSLYYRHKPRTLNMRHKLIQKRLF